MSQLPKRYDPLVVEKEILDFWSNEKVYDKTLKLRSSGPKWNFLEGPPTTNGFMHVGHARGRAMKDTQIRYMTMRGYDVWRRGGWDMQGLPVELEVEKNEIEVELEDIDANLEELNTSRVKALSALRDVESLSKYRKYKERRKGGLGRHIRSGRRRREPFSPGRVQEDTRL